MNTSAISGTDIRRLVLEQCYRAHVGHIGSALSIADILAALYSGPLNVAAIDDPERDRLVLSKGHAASALYAALHLKGVLRAEDLTHYCQDGSLLGVHPEQALDGVDFSTGSLGLGLPIGAGSALAARLDGSSRRVFVVLSDAECNEGSLWETAAFAAHHHLANLVAIVDVNGQQALGYTKDVLDMEPLARRWDAFGWQAHEVDGHNIAELTSVLSSLDCGQKRPHVLLARTVAGKGVSFMERQIKWHYWPMSDDEYGRALDELASA